jgi:nucleoside-diphosphate-sugar epimerase
MEAVIHLAAVIPPLADRLPHLAEHVNVDGTHNVIYSMEQQNPKPRLFFSSSVAVYGDRINSPFILRDDPPESNPEGNYARHKLTCERMIRESSLTWSIFRLTYIVDSDRLKLDPVMFDVPLDTPLEICDTKDVGRALAAAVTNEKVLGTILPIAGGKECRTTYRDYLQAMLALFGLGRFRLPEKAFTKHRFHCGYLDTEESQRELQYQGRRLVDFYEEVRGKYKALSRLYRVFSSLGKKILFLKSPYYVEFLKGALGKKLTKGALYLKFIFLPHWEYR